MAVNVVKLYVFRTTDRARLLLDQVDYISQRTIIIILTRDSIDIYFAPAFCLNTSLSHFSYCNATRELAVGCHGSQQRGYAIWPGCAARKRDAGQHKQPGSGVSSKRGSGQPTPAFSSAPRRAPRALASRAASTVPGWRGSLRWQVYKSTLGTSPTHAECACTPS